MKCKLCNGSAGLLIDGAHPICTARFNRSRPIKFQGDKCPDCHGTGNVSKATFCAEINPPASVFNAFFKPCVKCDGNGDINAE